MDTESLVAGHNALQSGQRLLGSSAPRLRRHVVSCEAAGGGEKPLPAGKDQKLPREFEGGALKMQTRHAPSRPYRSGSRRRHARQGHAAPEAGGARRGRATSPAPSLDTKKYLATSDENPPLSVSEWSRENESEMDRYRRQLHLHKELTRTVHRIWQGKANEAREHGDPEGIEWRETYETALKSLPGEDNSERWKRINGWLKENPPRGLNAEAMKWEKQFLQLQKCQAEWISYNAACCGDRTRSIAIPIGCNHRLCPLCSYHRSVNARRKVKTLFDRLSHPIFVTLTVPNTASIRKDQFTLLRQKIRKFIADHPAWFEGGIYCLETTFNRPEKTWHIHAHILADAAFPLPSKTDKRMLAGERVHAFTKLKLEMEFDWLRLWSSDWSKPAKSDAGQSRHTRDLSLFKQWILLARANQIRKWDRSRKQHRIMCGIGPEELKRRNEWNVRNRRLVDIRPVDNRERAAREVLKYITKGADFTDLPDAVEQFCDAVKGVRMVQTFGSWYGFNPDTVFDPEHMDDWGNLRCACGKNHWLRGGIVYYRDVEMDEAGRWLVKRSIPHNCGGTVPRPTIRALDAQREELEPCQPVMEIR